MTFIGPVVPFRTWLPAAAFGVKADVLIEKGYIYVLPEYMEGLGREYSLHGDRHERR